MDADKKVLVDGLIVVLRALRINAKLKPEQRMPVYVDGKNDLLKLCQKAIEMEVPCNLVFVGHFERVTAQGDPAYWGEMTIVADTQCPDTFPTATQLIKEMAAEQLDDTTVKTSEELQEEAVEKDDADRKSKKKSRRSKDRKKDKKEEPVEEPVRRVRPV